MAKCKNKRINRIKNIKLMMCFILAVVIIAVVMYSAFSIRSAGKFSEQKIENPDMDMAYALGALSIFILTVSIIVLWIVERSMLHMLKN